MKTALLTIFLLAHSYNVFAADAAGQFKFTEQECHDLAKELSDDAFENEKKLDSLKNSDRFSADTLKYLNETKISFSADLNKLCDTKKDAVTFDDIYKEESSCKETCKENLKNIKTPFLNIVEDVNQTKKKSETACFSVCDKDEEKLNAMKKGLTLAMKSQNKVSPDCSGAVSNLGRGQFKTFDQLDTGIKNSQTTGK